MHSGPAVKGAWAGLLECFHCILVEVDLENEAKQCYLTR